MTRKAALSPGQPAAKTADASQAPRQHRRFFVRAFFMKFACLLGLVALSFILGSAADYFECPPDTALFLKDAFVGGQAWVGKHFPRDTLQDVEQGPEALSRVENLDTPGKCCDGFTVIARADASTAMLLDMKGREVHRWHKSFSEIWPNPKHIKDPLGDKKIYYCGVRVDTEGNLLAVLQADGDTPYGYGLVKLDKDSNVVWAYPGKVHHEVDVGDDGRIYALTHEIVRKEQLPKGLEWIPAPCLLDYLVVLSPEGKEERKVPILDAFQDTPYRALLDELRNPSQSDEATGLGTATPTAKVDPKLQPRMPVRDLHLNRRWDTLHTNHVQVITDKLTERFPMFVAGQVLISMRELSTIAVLDLKSGKIVWAAQGPWRGQHTPQLLPNGHILLLDNHSLQGGSRVLEYDPVTQAIPWRWPDEPNPKFRTQLRGLVERLPNGNTFIVESGSGQLREVTPDGEMVWYVRIEGGHVASGRRYSPEELKFLDKLPVR